MTQRRSPRDAVEMVKTTYAGSSEILFAEVSRSLECDAVRFCRGYRCFGGTFCDAVDWILWCCRPTAVTAYGAAGQQQ